MDKLLITWIMLQLFSVLLIFVAGNEKTNTGKKVKSLGMALCAVTTVVIATAHTATLHATAIEIIFVLSAIGAMIVMYNLVLILKAVTSTERI